MGFELLIDKLSSQMSDRSIEQIIADSCKVALGKNMYGFYQKELGNVSDLGKTCEKLVRLVMLSVEKLPVEKEIHNAPIDIITTINGSKIGIEIKAPSKAKKFLGLNRIDARDPSGINDIEVKTQAYSDLIESYMISNGLESYYLSHIITSKGEINIHRLATIKDGVFSLTYPSTSYYKCHKKQTFFDINISLIVPILTEKFEPLKEPEQLNFPKKKLTTLEQFSKEYTDAMFKFLKFNNGPLGKKWGNKGKAFQKFLLDLLMKKYTNVFSGKGNSLADIIVAGLGVFQLKTVSCVKGNDPWYILCRSSKDGESIQDEIVCNSFFDSDEPIFRDGDLTAPRGIHVENKSKLIMSENNETKLYLIEINFVYQLTDMFILAELCEDGTLKKKGTYLADGYYTSSGGENKNQTHFSIRKRGLEKAFLDEKALESFEYR